MNERRQECQLPGPSKRMTQADIESRASRVCLFLHLLCSFEPAATTIPKVTLPFFTHTYIKTVLHIPLVTSDTRQRSDFKLAMIKFDALAGQEGVADIYSSRRCGNERRAWEAT